MDILIVDDHEILSAGVEHLIKHNFPDVITSKANSGHLALAILRAKDIDLIITDYSMPDMSGLEFVKNIRLTHHQTKIIVLTMHDEMSIVKDMIAAGVEAYILKKYTHHELLKAIDIVINGGSFWSMEISKLLIKGFTNQTKKQELSSREMEVLKLLCEELTSKEIAEKLFIGERTVETHRKNLLRKTQCSSTIGLIKYAYSKKII